VDLIIDSMLGCHQTLLDINSEQDRYFIKELMNWANDHSAPVLSLDTPSGLNGTTGKKD